MLINLPPGVFVLQRDRWHFPGSSVPGVRISLKTPGEGEERESVKEKREKRKNVKMKGRGRVEDERERVEKVELVERKGVKGNESRRKS